MVISAQNYGNGYSGISDISYGNLYGFNTTSGGENWFGFPAGEAAFSFASPIDAFGMYITGVQSSFTTTFTLTYDNGAPQTLNLPIYDHGGVAYVGFTDTSPFSSLTITNLSSDAWGIDNVTYNAAARPCHRPCCW